MKKLRALLLACAALGASAASADTLTFRWYGTAGIYDGTYAPTAGSGSIDPAYLQAQFLDTGTNTVRLTITSNMVAPAGVDKISFNVLPDEIANNLVMLGHSNNVLSFSEEPNSLHEGSVHTFDLSFDTGQGSFALGGQQVATIDLGLVDPTTPPNLQLLASSFNASIQGTITTGAQAGQSIDIYAAAHFQNVGPKNNDSSFIASDVPVAGSTPVGTPLPASVWAGGVLLGAVGLGKRRRVTAQVA
jgi:hypothetical protein